MKHICVNVTRPIIYSITVSRDIFELYVSEIAKYLVI